ncbi:MAG TPA: hypothetical protein VF219_16225 [Vicinamibacterales bacterium]
MSRPGERDRPTPATVVLVVTLVVHAVIGALAFQDAPEPQGDFDRYYEIASGAGRPYVDYQVEHPIGTLIVFKLLAAVPGGRASFGRGVVTVNAIADTVVIAALLGVWGVPAAAFYALVTIPIASLLFHRIDLWSMSAATLAVAAWRRHRPSLCALSLAVGASFKLWPLLLIFALRRTDHPRRAFIVFGLTAGATGAIALALGGPKAILEVLTFRGATGWQVESTAGSLVHLLTHAPPRMESGAWRIGTVDHLTSIAFFLAAAPVCLWASWRGFGTARPGVGWLAAVGWLLTLSALFSAQYVGWLAPAAGIAWTENHRRLAALTAVVIVLTQLFMFGYDRMIDGEVVMVLLVALRNVFVIVLTLGALAELRRPLLTEANLES